MTKTTPTTPRPVPDPFTTWHARVDRLCRTHLLCSWADLCGELDPLTQAFAAGETPIAFVREWCTSYDLTWYEAADFPDARVWTPVRPAGRR